MTMSHSALKSHLSNELLVRAMDDELSGSEAVQVEMHLAGCADCRVRQAELRRVSDGLEMFLGSLQAPARKAREQFVASMASGRFALQSRLEATKPKEQTRGTGTLLARFGWAVAAAATVAVGLSYLPLSHLIRSATTTQVSHAAANMTAAGLPFEMDGETFQYLPYSNPDLPLGGSHVVQMQVPLSSLADAGVLVEPTANRMTSPDRSVLADVLLGVDGQPIGVHVLSADL